MSFCEKVAQAKAMLSDEQWGERVMRSRRRRSAFVHVACLLMFSDPSETFRSFGTQALQLSRDWITLCW
jgi:hypothetical protein